MTTKLRKCFREPIPEIAECARLLDAAVSAHLGGRRVEADELIRMADMPKVREWTESIWGAGSPFVLVREVPGAVPALAEKNRMPVRMPNSAKKSQLHDRDGFHCRFCGVPVIRRKIRSAIRDEYPDALPWGTKNTEQHAGFQALWLQYDHLLPHARGGTNDLENIAITCAPCNFGRMNYLIEEVGLIDPMTRDPIRSAWDGLERFLQA